VKKSILSAIGAGIGSLIYQVLRYGFFDVSWGTVLGISFVAFVLAFAYYRFFATSRE
jgi:hypothetical protein